MNQASNPDSLRFEQLARFVASEDRDGDAGTAISSRTQEAYREMLKIFDDAIDSVHWNVIRSIEAVRHFIDDIPRTVLMIRAMHRAMVEKASSISGPLHVVEGGCGTGFLAGVAAALNPQIKIAAFDINDNRVTVSHAFLTRLGYGDRAVVEQRNLLKVPYQGEVDVLVAEHICRGLTRELATAIPRSFPQVDPNFVIPYGVTPVVFGNVDFHSGHFYPEEIEHLFSVAEGSDHACLHRGEEIILADPSSPDIFRVQGEMDFRPGLTPWIVGNDVQWASPRLRGLPLSQMNEGVARTAKPAFPDSFQNHLLGPALLASASSAEIAQYMGVRNDFRGNVQAHFMVKYPIGFCRFLANGDGPVASFESSSLKSCEAPSWDFEKSSIGDPGMHVFALANSIVGAQLSESL